jgi:hypothetical protein
MHICILQVLIDLKQNKGNIKMKKTIYIALGTLTILTNLANAASVTSAEAVSTPRGAVSKFLGQLSPLSQQNNWIPLGLDVRDMMYSVRNRLGDPSARVVEKVKGDDLDMVIMETLSNFRNYGSLPTDVIVIDMPYKDFVKKTAELLAPIHNLTDAEKSLWIDLYSLCCLSKGLQLIPEKEDHRTYKVDPGHLSLGEMIEEGCKVYEGLNRRNLNTKIHAYRAAVGLPPL